MAFCKRNAWVGSELRRRFEDFMDDATWKLYSSAPRDSIVVFGLALDGQWFVDWHTAA